MTGPCRDAGFPVDETSGLNPSFTASDDPSAGAEPAGLRDSGLRRVAGSRERTAGYLAELRDLFAAGAFASPPLSGPPYDAWRALDKARRQGERVSDAGPSASQPAGPPPAPLISVLLPVYNPRPEHLRQALDSLACQSWPYWECCAADDASTDPAIAAILRCYAEADSRFRVSFRPANGHICAATNTALDMARGGWCALLDQDDILEEDALTLVAAAIARHPDAAVIFSDEDQFEDEPGQEGEAARPEERADGRPKGRADDEPQHRSAGRSGPGRRFAHPFFKPGLDPDLLLGCNSVSHLGVYRSDVLRRLGGLRPGLEGAQDHDLALRCLAALGPEAFVHLPEPLYHWRRHAGSTAQDWGVKPYAREASLAARREYAAHVGLRAELALHPGSLYAAVRFSPPAPTPLLSLCLLVEGPGQDRQVLRRALENCSYTKREGIMAVAAEPLPTAERRALERLAAECHARFVSVPGRPDMFGLASAAAGGARGGALAFIRAGDMPARADWADRAVGALWRTGVGVTGCRGVLPTGFLSQAGYAAGRERPGGEGELTLCPAYAGLHVESGGYFRQAHLLRAAFAVHLAGLCCRRETFERLNGFDLGCGPLADADFCLRALTEEGLRSVVLPDADFLTPRAEVPRVAAGSFAARWSDLLRDAPPFQNPHLLWTPGGWQFRPPV